MRLTAIVMSVGFLIAVVGCESTRWSWLKNDGGRTPVADTGLPSVASLVAYMNENSTRVRTLSVQDLDITCTVGTQPFGLAAQMVVQKPRSLRMTAKALGNPEVDLGSNDQEFWYWVKRSQPPYQIFCSYKDLNEVRPGQIGMPLQPEWIMEAMGLGTYGPPEKYKLEHDQRNIRLVEKTTSPQGTAVRKVIVLERLPVRDRSKPQVTDFLLLDDATGKEICSAKITEVQIDRPTGAILPRRIELRYPAEKLRLAMKLSSTSVNQQLPEGVFARQTMAGVPAFNLATMKVDNSPPPSAFTENTRIDPKLRPAQGID